MELFILLGLVALVALAVMGGVAFLNERRMGTVLAVSRPRLPARNRPPAGPGASAHR
jgi:hypothetical protein